MATTRHIPRSGVAVAVLLVAMAGALGISILGPTPAQQDPSGFSGLLRAVHYDYEPVGSPEELRTLADIVVLGRIVDVTQGRTIHGIGSHATLVVDVEEVLAGDAALVFDDLVYVEFVESARATLADFRSRLPEGRLVLFLDDRTGIESSGPTGRPAETSVFAPFVQGVVLEAGQGYIGGSEDIAPMGPDWTRAKTFDEFVARLRS